MSPATLEILPCVDLANSLFDPCKNIAKPLLDGLPVACMQADKSTVASSTTTLLTHTDIYPMDSHTALGNGND